MLNFKDYLYLHNLVLFAKLHDKRKSKGYLSALDNKLITLAYQTDEAKRISAEDEEDAAFHKKIVK